MIVRLNKPKLGGTVSAIASKSRAHRLLICAALSENNTSVICSETSDDIDATVRCLNALGAKIVYARGAFDVKPAALPINGDRLLDCGESGSTLRFMLPVACALGARASFHMGGRLPLRPLSPLYEELGSHGCLLSPQGVNPLHISGQLRGGLFKIPGNISSQFISGLLFALPLVREDSRIELLGTVESKPYIDMTLSALNEFGIVIRSEENDFIISGNQRYTAKQSVNVEGDWSNAAFWLCAGALGEKSITVTNLNLQSLQGDKNVLPILERFGARLEYGSDSVTVSRGELKGIDIDAGDTPDLVPVLAAVAAVSGGRTTIYNAERLRIKESDRLESVTETLLALGADIKETNDGLIINGKNRLTGGAVNSHGDHRIAMTAAIVSSVCADAVSIRDAEAVRKSYPGFFTDLTALGGTYEEVM